MDWKRLAVFVLALALVPTAIAADKPARDQTIVCRFVEEPIVIDGRADEPPWSSAEKVDHFYQPFEKTNGQAASATTVRLLWDRQNLYFLAEMEDNDLYVDPQPADSLVPRSDTFRLLLKPAEDRPGYIDFQCDARGIAKNLFFPKRGADDEQSGIAVSEFHLVSKVRLQGTLDHRTDMDSGWIVEGAIPWRDFIGTGGRPLVDELWRFALCRYDGSNDSTSAKLSTSVAFDSQSKSNVHQFDDYALLRFAGPKQRPDNGGTQADSIAALKTQMSSLVSHVVGSPDPPLPYRARRVREDLKLSFPIYVESEPGTDRLLLIDQKESYGQARVCRTTDAPGEFETLIDFPPGGIAYSIAFHPHFAENGFMYVGWNGAESGVEKRCKVTRYKIDRRPPHALLRDSALTIIDWPSDGHNGAAIAFGKDGMLYITSGDGTSDSDTNLKGQGLDHLLAKLLRIDVDHPQNDRTYSVPPDNPFVGKAGVRPETWAYGFRNPWRITVDPKTGDVWVGNNGQDLWEQAFLVQRGANYGWSVYEGSHLFYSNRQAGPTPVSKPTLEHPHSEARSLTGGVVYYGQKLPELRGAYIYGDYSTGKIWAAKVERDQVAWHKEIADTTLQLTCFALDPDGELLLADHRGNGEGGLYTLEPNQTNAGGAEFPRQLSETGLFKSVAGHHVHPGLMPYSVNAPLWSDGAYKERFLFLPRAASPENDTALARFDFTFDDRGWILPDGTIALKSFALDSPARRRWIETRLLVKQEGEWVGYSYAWNDQQTEATLVDAAGLDRAFDIARGEDRSDKQVWHYPSRTECMVCHSRAANFVLGLSTVQFNKTCELGNTRINQLEVLERLSVLRVNWLAEQQAVIREELKKAGKSDQEADDTIKRISDSRGQREAKASSLLFKSPSEYQKVADPYDERVDLTVRAKSYLHSNCAQCHVEAGGGNAQMQLSWSTPLEKMKLIGARPLHHTFDIDQPRLVAPGDPARSVLLHRMSTRGPGQMPQLATSVVDNRAVDLIRQWIEKLPVENQASAVHNDSPAR